MISLAPTGLRLVPSSPIINVVNEAMKLGFSGGNPDWVNLGQGEPEVGEMEGAPPRLSSIQFNETDCGYGPVGGLPELRQAIADEYNRLYRVGKSQYTKDNVAVAAGGRVTLWRLLASLGEIRVGHFIPDYAGYEVLLEYHQHRFTPVALPTSPLQGFMLSPEEFAKVVAERKLGAVLASNPCNPTGAVLRGDVLSRYVDTARREACWLLLDEFYSHYIFEDGGAPAPAPVSSAEFVEDVNRDPVAIVDGLTKNHRYPGLRLSWVLGPAGLIDMVSRAASATDGGPSTVTQRIALQALEPARAQRETTAVREGFARKRKLMIDSLREMGIEVPAAGNGSFYVWANVGKLPAALNTDEAFYRTALQHKVVVVPGSFFDINPGQVRTVPSFEKAWVRFSCGPKEERIRMGLERLRNMISQVS